MLHGLLVFRLPTRSQPYYVWYVRHEWDRNLQGNAEIAARILWKTDTSLLPPPRSRQPRTM